MPANYKCDRCNLDDEHQEPREDEPFLQMIWGEEEGMATSSSSASSSPHHSPEGQDMAEEESDGGDPDPSHNPSSAHPYSLALAIPSASSQHEEGAAPGASSQDEEGAAPSASNQHEEVAAPGAINQHEEGDAEGQASPQEALHEKMTEVVEFLLLKYRSREPTSQAEILREVLSDNQEHLPVAFRQACECLQLVFGLEVQETEPNGDSYVVVITLGLTYDGLMSPEDTMPKTGLLVIVLAVILLGGDRTSEERMWEALSVMGVFVGVEHFIFGDPRVLLTEAWVQEQYLEYQQVPNSDPARYEFLWGPRAHAETNKVDVLEHLLKVNKKDPSCLLALCGEAVSDMEDEA
ncbi:melanoma-associated antigen 8-like [Talpa occidentalis]|uniref:melanoma-associated antigen 8-like n=1 Tax=Talpa occidentalis TaxID=50954 RepID=UPI0018904052|nr:melanoma-associated antigen 8-like [Talpa occidentalis]XP_054551881.1 melanoma-associated antigen 8-like [Talpa occidentalis]